MTGENYLKNLADMQTQIKELVPDSLKENGERRMNFCRKGIPCEYATINGFCQLTACLKHLRERKEE